MSTGSSVLFVAGGDDVMRRTFRERECGYWSSQFPLLLEKHGIVDFTTAEPDILASLGNLECYALVIVAWLPEAFWRPEYIATLRNYDGPVFLEGPLPPALEKHLGVTRALPAVEGLQGSLTFSDEAASYIRARFGAPFPIGHRSGPDPSVLLSPDGDPTPLELAPRESVTRKPGLSRDIFRKLEAEPVEQNAARAATSLVLAYAARLRQDDRFFEDSLDNALALLACVRCFANVSSRGPLGAALHRLVVNAGGSNRRPPPRGDARALLARAVWATALAEAATALGDPTFAERAKEMLADVQADWLGETPLDPLLSRWRLLLALELTGAPSDGQARAALAGFLPADERLSAMRCWLDASLTAQLGAAPLPPVQAGTERIAAIAASLEDPGEEKLGHELDGLNVPDLMLVLGSLQRRGHRAAAVRLWRVVVDDLYDAHDGLFLNAQVVDGELEPARGRSVSPLVALGLLDAAGQVEILHAPTEALDRYTAAQLEAWAAPPYAFQPYRGVAAEDTLIALETRAGSFPGVWRAGNLTVTSFQLLAQLVHVHTVEPLAEPFSAFRSGDAIALEYLLMHLLGSSVATDAPRVVTVAPWPWDTHYVVTVRHDVDRLLEGREFKRLVDFERKHDLAVTWFWLPERLDEEQLRELEQDSSREIALHAVRLEQKADELDLLGQAVTRPLAGESLHGSGDGWLGHLTVRAAADAGLIYTELAPPVADVPYARYPVLETDGRVDAERIVGVSYNISIESKLGDKPGSEGGPGLYRQLLNHPDLNFDRLRDWVKALPSERHLHWTCEQVARWWRATHTEEGLTIRHLPGEETALRFEVSSDEAVEDLELRLPCRPESVAEVSVDEASGEWTYFAEPEYSGIRVRVSLSPRTPRTVVVRLAGGPAE